jgi:pimeloyl-ACP methyl ester carboxylesterase
LPADRSKVGYLPCGLPYNRLGHGSRPLVVFQGLLFEHKPHAGLFAGPALSMYRFLQERYMVYIVGPRPGLPAGCDLGDIARDYAEMIRQEFGGPVDVIGTSTGGSVALHFAANHPEALRRLVIHSSAHRLGPQGRAAQQEVAALARQGRWREAFAALLRLVVPPGLAAPAMVALASHLMAFVAPKDPADLIAVIDAEDHHAFRERLGEILAPTLVIAGARDAFYTEALFRETAEGIPGARLVLYPRMGHPARGRAFEAEVLAFLGG